MTQTRPFPFHELRSYSASQASATRALSQFASRSGSAAHTILDALGATLDASIQLTFMGIETFRADALPSTPAGWCAELRLPSAGAALLHVDPYLSHRFLQSVLPDPPSLGEPLGPMGYAGMCFVALQALEPLAQHQGIVPTLSVVPPDLEDLTKDWRRLRDVHVLTWVLSVGQTAGLVSLWANASWVEALPQLQSPLLWADHPLTFPVILGNTELNTQDLATLSPRDIVLLDTHAYFGDAAAYVRLDHNVRLGCTYDSETHQFTLQGGPIVDSASTELMTKTRVDLEVQIGSTSLTLTELGSLQPGAILELDTRVGDPVTLLVHGKPMGTGELVEVDGRVGVRVLARA